MMRLLLVLLKMILCLKFSREPPARASPLASDLRAEHRRLTLLVAVEGSNDAEFLRRVSKTLHRTEPSLPNYLDPQAIRETLGAEVTFSDNDSVAEAVAQRLFALEEGTSLGTTCLRAHASDGENESRSASTPRPRAE